MFFYVNILLINLMPIYFIINAFFLYTGRPSYERDSEFQFPELGQAFVFYPYFLMYFLAILFSLIFLRFTGLHYHYYLYSDCLILIVYTRRNFSIIFFRRVPQCLPFVCFTGCSENFYQFLQTSLRSILQ